ncbi:MAG TPA: transposase [Candidatus Limiplasma sp.]|nr:transposase [Candidatus Limiplasma sp.]
MKYTSEKKSEALKSIQDVGVTKTAEALKISVQTLYKWRTEADAQQFETAKSKGHRTAKAKETLDARALLEKDKSMAQKIAQLEAENIALHASLMKYRAALAAALGEDN